MDGGKLRNREAGSSRRISPQESFGCKHEGPVDHSSVDRGHAVAAFSSEFGRSHDLPSVRQRFSAWRKSAVCRFYLCWMDAATAGKTQGASGIQLLLVSGEISEVGKAES